MTAEQNRSLALLVLTTIALGSLMTVKTIADPVAPSSEAAPAETRSALGENAAPDRSNEVTVETIAVESATDPADRKVLLTGQVVPLHDALERKKIKSYPEEAKGQFVLETESGELHPIVSDGRGRAFYQDERLRNRKVTVLCIRRLQLPHLQVLSIYTYDDAGHSQLTDYWCDICSIPMYEIKKCECCQGPTRLRFQKKKLPKLEKAIAN